MLLSACQSAGERNAPPPESRGVIIVNAPQGGEVRRVLVAEGVKVAAGTPLFEIAVIDANAPPATRGDNSQQRAVGNITAAQAETKAAREEVVRYEVEVQRLTPLVAAGNAAQGEMDAARALYDRAQQRLQRALDAERNAQAGLVAARQPNQPAPAPPTETIVTANASSAGTVAVINARVGMRVMAGQPLATLRADE